MKSKDWRKKVFLFKQQNGLCCLCGERMNLIKFSSDHPHGIKFPSFLRNHSTTFEHIDDRFSFERGLHHGEQRIFLAHSSCNEKRGKETQKAFFQKCNSIPDRIKFLRDMRHVLSQRVLAGDFKSIDRITYLRGQEEYYRKVLAGQSVKQKVKRKEIKDSR